MVHTTRLSKTIYDSTHNKYAVTDICPDSPLVVHKSSLDKMSGYELNHLFNQSVDPFHKTSLNDSFNNLTNVVLDFSSLT